MMSVQAEFPSESDMRHCEESCSGHHAKLIAIDVKQSNSRSVCGLLQWCRPSAITRLIIPVPIGEAIQRMLRRWLRSHVRQEIFERCLPARADLNPASAISRVVIDARTRATTSHALPSVVFLGSESHTGMSMCGAIAPHASGGLFALPASAAPAIAFPQFCSTDDAADSAIADAVPRGRSTVSDVAEHRPASESLPADVDDCSHVALYFTPRMEAA
jgi:hypothetical protein